MPPRSFGYSVFPAPAGVAEPALRAGERVYIWQWGATRRVEGRATVVSSSAGAAPVQHSQRSQKSQKEAGWQPQVDRAAQGRSSVRYADGTTADVRNGRITRVVDANVAAPRVIITPDTDSWRQLARSQLDVAVDDAMDIGCSVGAGTAVIAEHCRSVVGVDVGKDGARFEAHFVNFLPTFQSLFVTFLSTLAPL